MNNNIAAAVRRPPLASTFLSDSLFLVRRPQTSTDNHRHQGTKVNMRDRSKNRKQLQRGRNLSIEAIQTIQALKRASRKEEQQHILAQVFDSKFRRLLKFDMMAVLRELLRQNQCHLALKVFEDIRQEYWYKSQVSLYAEMISLYASNGLFETVRLLHSYMIKEGNIQPDIEGFNALLQTLLSFKITDLAMESYDFMKSTGCEPDRMTFRILINGLESMGAMDISAIVRQDAQVIYGSLEFLQDEEEMAASCT